MEGPQKAPVVCSHSFTKETLSTAVQEPRGAIAGAQPRPIMTLISSGGSVQVAFCVTVVTQMETAVIFLSFIAVKCTQLVPVKMQPNPGVLQLITMTWTGNGAIVAVRKIGMKS